MGQKVPDMPATTELDGTEILYTIQGGVDKNIPGLGQLVAYIKAQIQNSTYPVGTIYTNKTDSRNPNEILGFGTWVAIEAGRTIVAAGGGYAAGTTGGEATHTLTVAEIPAHHHHTTSRSGAVSSGPTASPIAFMDDVGGVETGDTGGGGAHNNMPPWLAAYAWERTA